MPIFLENGVINHRSWFEKNNQHDCSTAWIQKEDHKEREEADPEDQGAKELKQ